jgi:hypothetical protein
MLNLEYRLAGLTLNPRHWKRGNTMKKHVLMLTACAFVLVDRI